MPCNLITKPAKAMIACSRFYFRNQVFPFSSSVKRKECKFNSQAVGSNNTDSLNGSSASHHSHSITTRQMDNRRNSAEQQKALKGRKSGAVYIGYCTIVCYSHNYYH
ncbi:hypothetical protein WUBG_08180 [Wuchereria bancrofti]|uniref:Uncharacterized protein n=1 Tax=Wuchereria bancrofti TaxID=6293 RepID=J9EEL3_WUCBA|nr:hypothetical protein WUBG_08180 [Wuchereria bancrofti]